MSENEAVVRRVYLSGRVRPRTPLPRTLPYTLLRKERAENDLALACHEPHADAPVHKAKHKRRARTSARSEGFN